YNVMDVCDSEKVDHPTIISESGRALVAHHSILIVEAFGSIEKNSTPIALEEKEGEIKQLRDMRDLQKALTMQNRMETLHDAQQIKEQAQSMFELGLLDLESKARIEMLYWRLAQA